ncbi:signal-regulatory protein beta-2-like [Enoplosus armatus]|uniref:signal-regulatory protein beta-2-like n=1 Tax=Enoplosus armatus TaxID=215367 RepID=UPI003993FECA
METSTLHGSSADIGVSEWVNETLGTVKVEKCYVRCTNDQNFETKTVAVGQNVTLTCTRQTSGNVGSLFWIKVVAGNLPEILGRAFNFDYDDVNGISRITSKQEPGRFVLHITKSKLSDTAFYYCLKSRSYKITFLKGTFLRIKGAESDITAITQDFPSDPVHSGDSVTLQCSVLSHSEKKTCQEEDSVHWFRARSDESHPNLIYVQENSGDECEKSPDARSPQKCVYSFSKKVSSSDAGTYYCAVAACGEILFGHGTKLDIEAVVTLQTNAATASQQRNEDSLVYSTPHFTRRKAGKAERRNARKEETIYTDIRAFENNKT